MALGTNLKNLRLKKGWSQEELSNRSGVSQSFISAIESENKDLTLGIAHKLAKAFEISLQELI